MKLGTTDISIMNVRNITGCPSTDLGTLCVASSDGNGYAFKIVENGYTTGNGYIFADDLGFPTKYPYWNVFSNNSPAEWVAAQYPAKILSFRIKRDSSNRYMFSLGSFSGYDSDAKPPSVPSVTASFVQNVTVNKYPVNIHNISLGDYDWSKLGAKYAKLVMFNNSNLTTADYQTGYFSITETNPIATLNLTLNTSSAFTRDYTMVIVIADAGQSDIGILPVMGTFSIVVTAQTTVRIFANITGSNGISTTLSGTAVTGVYGNATVSNKVKITSAHKQPKNYNLTSVNIVCRDGNGNVVYDKNRSPDYRDMPSSYYDVYEVGVGSELTMWAYVPTEAWNTISSTGCSVTITLVLN